MGAASRTDRGGAPRSMRLAHVVGDIGGHAEDRPGFQHAGQWFQVLRRHEPAPVVAGFGPGIGVEQEGAGDMLASGSTSNRSRTSPGWMRILSVPAFAADLAQKHGDAVDIGLRPDDPHIRVLLRPDAPYAHRRQSPLRARHPCRRNRLRQDPASLTVRVFLPGPTGPGDRSARSSTR